MRSMASQEISSGSMHIQPHLAATTYFIIGMCSSLLQSVPTFTPHMDHTSSLQENLNDNQEY